MGFGRKFAYSFFDFTAYKEFLVQGLGKSVLYIFLVTLLFSTITNFKTIDTINSEISAFQDALVNVIPSFEFSNGEFSINSSEPVYYKHDGDILIIDTANKTDASVLDPYSNGMFINSEKLVYRQDYTTLYSLDLSNYSDLTFTNTSLEKLLMLFQILFPVALFICTPIISFLINLAAGFIVVGPLSLFISSLMEIRINYYRACTLSFYAMTLPLLLEALLNVSGIEVDNFYVLFYVLSLIYCCLALKEIKNIDKSNINISK